MKNKTITLLLFLYLSWITPLLAGTLGAGPTLLIAPPNASDMIRKINASPLEFSTQQSEERSSADAQASKESSAPSAHSDNVEEGSSLLRAYNGWSFAHQRKIFNWQFETSQYLFWVVLLLVLGGFGLAFWQFRADTSWRNEIRRKIRNETDIDRVEKLTELAQGKTHQFEFSQSGFKIQSSVIGLVVLAISLGFFYLYLENVYPVKKVDIINLISK